MAIAAEGSKRGEIDAQAGGDDFKESATASGAAVVHGEIPHAAAVFEGDELAVLAADLDDGANVRRQVMNTLGMASDLRDGCVRKAYGVAAVTGGNNGFDGGAVHLRDLTDAFEQFAGQALLLDALIGEAGAKDARLFGIEQHDFGRSRPCIYAGTNHACGVLHTSGDGTVRASKWGA